MNFKIRPVEQADLDSMLYLMSKFAEFDGSADQFIIEKNELGKAFFEDPKKLNALVVELENELIGFLNYHFTFSSFSLRSCLWVEDVFVLPSFRGEGIGEALFNNVRQIAVEKECLRLEWLVRNDNDKGKRFYHKIGATIDDSKIYVSWYL